MKKVGEILVELQESASEKSVAEKVVEKELELKREIEVDMGSIPQFVSFGERLEQIKNDLNQKQITEAEALVKYEKLSDDMQEVRTEIERSGLTRGAYGIYVVLKEHADTDDDRMIRCAENIYTWVQEHLDTGWQATSRRDQHIRGLKQHIQELFLGKHRKMVERGQILMVINRISDAIIKIKK